MTGPDGPLIAVVDYGVGNRRSVEKALLRVGANAQITADATLLRAADGLVIPGVGAFPAAARRLAETGLDQLIREIAAVGTPILGACLGMQLLFDHSDEHGGAAGLRLIAGEVRALQAPDRKLPHIGWSEVRWQGESPLSAGLPDPSAFYHVHSYAAWPASEQDVIGWSDYGQRYASVVGSGNIFGVQFHPEKSSSAGLALLANFVRICELHAQ